MAIKTKFGKIIKELRSEKGLSQEELADRAGMHRTYIGMIERAEKNITIENICKLSKALDVPLSSIFLEIEKDG
jgi:transcriptional regulator with XRE-family HTH domain